MLGPLEVRDRDGARVPVGGPRQRAVLAALAINNGTLLSVDRLTELVWGEYAPARPSASLATHVSRLRAALGNDVRIDHQPGGYVLHLGNEVEVDTEEFIRLRGTASAMRERGDVEEAGVSLRRALDLWCGNALADLDGSPMAESLRARWATAWWATYDDYVATQLELGHHDVILPELEARVRDEPLRERIVAHLLVALVRSGRASDALAVYEVCRTALAEELGADPSEELQDLHTRILRQDPSLQVPSPAPSDSPQPTPSDHRRRVPRPRTPLIGRLDERDTLLDLVGRARVVTVTGTGGAGKTRLATEVARELDSEFPGGAVFVDLATLDTALYADVVRVLASSLGVRMVGDPAALWPTVVERLAAAPTLLLVDNCEHVLEPAARSIDALLDEVDSLVVLATSRHPLDVGGEHVLPLAPLASAAASALLCARLEARRPGSTRDVSAVDVEKLCDALDRLPLAIELACGLGDHLSVAELARVAQDGVATVGRPHHGVNERHRSLEAAIRWSLDLLDHRARVALRRMATFRGPVDAALVAAATTDVVGGTDVEDVLATLVRHALVVADPGPSGTAYRLLDTIREVARDELHELGEWDQARQHHAAALRHRAHQLAVGATTMDMAEALALEPHHVDLVAALEYADAIGDERLLADLADHASGLVFCPGGLPDAAHWLRRASATSQRLDPQRLADLRALAMNVAMLDEDWDRNRALFEQAAEHALDHPGGVAPFALVLGMCDPSTARRAGELADQLSATFSNQLRDDVRLALRAVRPLVRLMVGEDTKAVLAEAEEVWQDRRWSDRRQAPASWTVHAALLHLQGRHVELQRRLDEMEPIPPRLGPPTFFRSVFAALARAGAGERDAAIDELRTAREHHWVGIPGVDSDLLSTLGDVLLLTGDPEAARRLLDRPGLRARHPGTAIVHIAHRHQLGLPVESFRVVEDHGPPPDLSEVLDEALDAASSPAEA